MLRICFIGGYAIMILLVIAFIAIKTIAVVGAGGLGDFAAGLDSKLSEPKYMALTTGGLATFLGLWITSLVILSRQAPEWERKWVKTLIIGCAFMMVFFVILGFIAVAAIYLEGLPKEFAEKVAGMVTSPVLMELSFFFFGLILLFSFNIIRRIREGDEYVYLEIVDAPQAKESLPAEKQRTIYKEEPQAFDDDLELQLSTIEGALDMRDHKQAFELLMDLPEEVIDTPRVRALRQKLIELEQD
ncbi:hypothetical protein SAMN02745181_2662 [Rubritalea squalenifaciens DSM 18772]|uniref:Uncharacterized protein n=1 Tax=Rubritalea squalenifaciens DSM 18772 TaxID=1123071 RepID=A0A1M6MA07_9BACT|nr:hypothetical protein [Rubritalea squalenifaciens]SHJ80315.1 hypothetical protein SAMN02745181_2662 [Rubritalea squalenifaciens DSM 18772]